MSFAALAWAVRQKLPCTQKCVLLMLAERHNGDTGQCNPSHERLADDCGLSRRSVMDQVAKLEAAGYLRVRHRAANNTKLPNQYVLVFSFGVQQEVKDFAEVVQELHKGSEPAARGVVNVLHKVVNVLHKGSERAAHKPVIEPVKEPKREDSAGAQPRFVEPVFVLPDWVNPVHWDAWHSSGKRRNATTAQKNLAVEKLDAWRLQGVDHALALQNAAVGGWQGLFEPDTKTVQHGKQPGNHAPVNRHAAAAAAIFDGVFDDY